MDGLILAAGMATRLKPLSDELPKALLKLNNHSILKYIIDNLLAYNVNRIILITGFQENKIKEFIRNNYDNKKFVFVTNKEYAETNNAYSLLLSENVIDRDFILLDSDIIFEKEIIHLLTKEPKAVMVAIKKHKLAQEEIKVIMTDQGLIKRIGKDVPVAQSYGESIGIEYFPQDYIKPLFDTLKKRVLNENRYNEFYEASFQEMIENGYEFYGVDIGELEAIEIDYKEDLRLAERIVNDKMAKFI